MSKKIVYFMSAIAMLALAVAIGFLLSHEVPTPLTEEAYRAQQNSKMTQIEPLEPIENLITHSAEGKPIPTSALSDKYAQVQQELAVPPDFSDIDFSAQSTTNDPVAQSGEQRSQPSSTLNVNTSNGQNSSHLESEKNTVSTDLSLTAPPVSTPATEKKQAELDEMFAAASAITPSTSEQSNQVENNMSTTMPVQNNSQVNAQESSLSTTQNTQNREQAPSISSVQTPVITQPNSNTSTTNTQASTINSNFKIPKLKSNALITTSKADPIENKNVVINATLSMDGDQVQLRILGNKPIQGSCFILDNPDRIVFDIAGAWEITLPRLISNWMVRNMRLGQTDEQTRIVFDMKVTPKSANVIQLSEFEILLLFR